MSWRKSVFNLKSLHAWQYFGSFVTLKCIRQGLRNSYEMTFLLYAKDARPSSSNLHSDLKSFCFVLFLYPPLPPCLGDMCSDILEGMIHRLTEVHVCLGCLSPLVALMPY